ncbi:MAG: sugar transferase, partial [Armatimonadota bacterium]|nr:sugar transferase [Armatimonadota bacterium]
MTERVLNAAFATILLALLSPLWIFVCVAVAIDSPGPLFFRPLRVGRNGRYFHVWKFRTMSTRECTEQKSSAAVNQPRLTRVGAVLQRLSIDEVPQLLNIITGHMCLVGPRPENPKFIHHYTDDESNILEVTPGITGSSGFTLFDEKHLFAGTEPRATVYARDVLPQKVAADLQYVNRRTFAHTCEALLVVSLQFLRAVIGFVPGRLRTSSKLLVDCFTVVIACLLAHFIRLGVGRSAQELPTTLLLLVPLLLLRVGCLYVSGAYRSVWRYTGLGDFERIVWSTSVSSAMFGALLYMFNWGLSAYPRSIFIIEWAFSTLGMMATRMQVSSGRRLISSRTAGPD